jgi:hypothetical protein
MKKCVLALLVLVGCGAQQVKVAPVKVEPIHLTIDVNVHDKADPANSR